MARVASPASRACPEERARMEKMESRVRAERWALKADEERSVLRVTEDRMARMESVAKEGLLALRERAGPRERPVRWESLAPTARQDHRDPKATGAPQVPTARTVRTAKLAPRALEEKQGHTALQVRWASEERAAPLAHEAKREHRDPRDQLGLRAPLAGPERPVTRESAALLGSLDRLARMDPLARLVHQENAAGLGLVARRDILGLLANPLMALLTARRHTARTAATAISNFGYVMLSPTVTTAALNRGPMRSF